MFCFSTYTRGHCGRDHMAVESNIFHG